MNALVARLRRLSVTLVYVQLLRHDRRAAAEQMELIVEPSLPTHAPDRMGSTIGLFWVNGERVYVGTPPAAGGPGVLLSPVGVRITGPAPHAWRWSAVMDLQVLHVPVRSTLVRWAARGLSVAAAALDAWVPGSPAEMTVAVTTTEGESVESTVYSGAAIAYTQREVDLSLGLLARFTRGEASPVALTNWWNETQPVEVLRSREREAVLESWLGMA
ncbi:hypothetical protein AB0M57_24740 [Streptomyces sp. NPDC051597]|uniref:hypothetical protein n=1 Tax=Streptomyces sp. NPDC051597 TaxID=3155049 RepID=UPI00342EDDA4